MNGDVRELLENVKNGSLSVDDAVLALKKKPFEDIGFAKVDLHRKVRQGAAEVIYGAGKTAEQIAAIAETMLKNSQNTILITRLAAESAAVLKERFPMRYDETARIGIIGTLPPPSGNGTIVVATGGTSDIPVAEEAAITAEALGNKVTRLYDVGVAAFTGCWRIWTTSWGPPSSSPSRGWRGRWQASLVVWRTAPSSPFPPAWATVPRSTAYPPYSLCSTPALAAWPS